MNIRYKKYLIKPTSDDRFDLFKTEKKTGEAYKKRNATIAYDIRLGHALHLIVMGELKNNTDTVSLKEFIEAYKKEKQELLQIINH